MLIKVITPIFFFALLSVGFSTQASNLLMVPRVDRPSKVLTTYDAQNCDPVSWVSAACWAGGSIPPDTILSGDVVNMLTCQLAICDWDRIIFFNEGSTLNVGTSVGLHNFQMSGTTNISPNGSLTSGFQFNNHGTINNQGTLVVSARGLGNTGSVINQNLIYIVGPNFPDGQFHNNGILDNRSGATIEDRGHIQNNIGGTFINNGSVSYIFKPFENRGIYTGNGTIDMGPHLFRNEPSGRINPGNAIGTTNITGNFENQGTINIEIGGNAGGGVDPNGHDRVIPTGTATIGGKVNVFTTNGFVPSLGQSWVILDAGGTLAGTFAPGTYPMVPGGSWRLSYDNAAGTVTLHAIAASRADFDGDGRTDVSVFRPNEGNWYIQRSTAGLSVHNWGLPTDVLTPADFDGDLLADLAIFRPSANEGEPDFFILNSNGFTISGFEWGLPGDVPKVGHYDLDGKADVAVFRPATSDWMIRLSGTGTARVDNFGLPGDIPIVMDYDGDGRDNIAVFRPSTNFWYMARSTGVPAQNFESLPFGAAGDIPVPADYDGDSKTDVAVFRPSNGTWYILRSTNGSVRYAPFGNSTDVPVPGDYDGDGSDDIAIYRNGQWWIDRSTAGLSVVNLGIDSDKPLPAAYIP